MAKELAPDSIDDLMGGLSMDGVPPAFQKLGNVEKGRLLELFKECENINHAIEYLEDSCERRRELYQYDKKFQHTLSTIQNRILVGSSTFAHFYHKLETMLVRLVNEFSSAVHCCRRGNVLAVCYDNDQHTNFVYDVFLCEACGTNSLVIQYWFMKLYDEHHDLVGGRFYITLNGNSDHAVIAAPSVITTPEKIVDIVRQRHIFYDLGWDTLHIN
jgi:hypothetical protein